MNFADDDTLKAEMIREKSKKEIELRERRISMRQIPRVPSVVSSPKDSGEVEKFFPAALQALITETKRRNTTVEKETEETP